MAAGYKKLGKYDVLDVIGRGGMGVIYKGQDPAIGRVVAIKMMTGAFVENPELLQRFYREAQSAGKLQHPNIVTIYDLGVQDSNPYLVMEFLSGESLESAIQARRSIPLEDKINIVIQVCNGLGYAHQRQIIHRDVKPANVMLLQDGGVKIVDFGIARVGNDGMTRPGQLLGSFQYMSPEQINGEAVDARSDLFSVGVLFYEFLTDTLPFQGKDTGDTLLKILHEPPPPLSRFLKSCPPELEELIVRVLAKNREERYQAAEDLAFDLAHIQEELKRQRASEYLELAQTARSQGQLTRAKEQLLLVLKVDRQNTQANALLKEVQREIQKQQSAIRARELQSEAENAAARGQLVEALGYLDEAVQLDPQNLEISALRDSLREAKARADKVHEFLQRAERAQEAGDLDDAHQAVDAALGLDPSSTEVRALQASIAREIAEREKQAKLQKVMGDARQQISSRRFTAALQLLQQAESIDPSVPGIQELLRLAASGQQQERRRKELERLTSEIEEALNRDDYVSASAKADEGLRSYPDDRGLKKLRAVAEKQREAAEKRSYIDARIASTRKFLDEQNPEGALAHLQEALQKYSGEFALKSMLTLVTESLERQKAEQRRNEFVQKAKDAMRRKDYAEAISTLEAAREESQSTDFDDLLQFAQEEAANYAKRQRIDAVAEQAHRLSSEEKYAAAIELLETTLQEVPDQELQIILADNQRHLEEFNQSALELVSNSKRLILQDRFGDAVKLLEAQSSRYANVPEFVAALADAQAKQQLAIEFSILKEKARDALSRSQLDEAQELWDRAAEKFSQTRDFQLLGQEIANKRREAANSSLEMAVRDARMLLLVQSFDSALSVLETVSGVASHADPELGKRFTTLLDAARRGTAKREEEQRKATEPARGSKPGTTSNEASSGRRLPDSANADQTQLTDPAQLEAVLKEVKTIADHYRASDKVQTAIHDLEHTISTQISQLQEATELQTPVAEIGSKGESQSVLEAESGIALSVPAIPTVIDLGAVDTAVEEPRPAQVVEEPAPAPVTEGAPPALVEAPLDRQTASPAPAHEVVPTDIEVPKDAIAPEPDTLQEYQVAIPTREQVAPETQDQRAVATIPPLASRQQPAYESQRRTLQTIAAVAAVVVIGAALYLLRRPRHISQPVPPPQTSPANVSSDPVAQQQKAAIDDCDMLIAADDLPGAEKKLQSVAGLNGPLNGTVQERLAGVEAAMKDENVHRLRLKEEQLWQDAVKQVDSGKFSIAKNDLQQILRLGDAGTRKPDARQYLAEVIPGREQEHRLFEQAKQASAETSSAGLQRASGLLDQVIALNGPHKSDALGLRSKVNEEIGALQKQQREQKLTSLQQSAAQNIAKSDLASARQNARDIQALGGDPATLLSQIDNAENARRVQLDAAYQLTQQRTQEALSSGDKSRLQASQVELQSIMQGGGAHSQEAGDLSKQVSQKLASLSQPSVVPPTPPTNTSLPTPTGAEADVRAALEKFNAAFDQGRTKDVKAIWPTADKKYTDAMHPGGGYAFAMALTPQGPIQISGDNAAVPCQLLLTTKKPNGQDQSKRSVKVTLRRGDRGWLILDPLAPN
ncbi:MAG: protein kinase [Acidobacteriaceae bacterium]|nr:protein kinase [Acidobacteriaceae bacterium]